MNDQQFLNEYIKATKLIFSSLTEDIVTIKDINNKFLALTHKMLEFLGVDSEGEIIGKNYDEIKDSLSVDGKLIEEFKVQNKKIVKSGKNKVYLEIVSANGEKKIYIAHKTPIINPTTQNCVGVKTHITKMYWPNIIKVLLKMRGVKGLLLDKKNVGNPLEDFPLSEMQHLVLYLSLSNYSYSEISLFLNEFGYDATLTRVNDCLERLKLIFHVKTKIQLIEKAIGLNFHTFLPHGLFNLTASIDITEESAKIVII